MLLARSVFLLVFALAGCAINRKNPFGHRRAPFAACLLLSCTGIDNMVLTQLNWGDRRKLLLVRGIFGYGAIMNCAHPVSSWLAAHRLPCTLS